MIVKIDEVLFIPLTFHNFIKFENYVHDGKRRWRRRDGDGEKENGYCRFFFLKIKYNLFSLRNMFLFVVHLLLIVLIFMPHVFS